jgi:hypothetical protein
VQSITGSAGITGSKESRESDCFRKLSQQLKEWVLNFKQVE